MLYDARTTLRPGLLVSLKTTIMGNVHYTRRTIQGEHVTATGALEAEWETKKHVTNAAEHDAAKKARADARNAIAAVCAHSAFGLLCPQDDETKLREAINKAKAIVEAFNKDATLSRINVYVITGTVSENDAEAMNAIHSEILDLLMQMDEGVERGEVQKARDACNAARDIGTMLTSVAAAKLQQAIDDVRNAARRIKAKGDDAAELTTLARESLDSTMAFFAGNGKVEVAA